jgi:polyisoprenoid-binding protein YceI
MKRFRFACVFAGLALGSFAPAQAAVETYDIDPVHSWVGFTVSHFFTKVPGFFSKVNGTFVVDRDRLENSTAEAVIEAASITTNTGLRDDHLRSAKFFDVAAFPTVSFKSKAWKSTGGDTYDVTGDLTIKGVKKEVVLKVTSRGFGPGMKGATISGWEVSAALDRRDYGISADQGPIGNTVDVLIFVEAGLRTPAQTTSQSK